MTPTEKRLSHIESLAKLLDRQFRFPKTHIYVGLDGIIGLIPVIGDSIGLLLSSWILYHAHQLKLPFRLKCIMGWNMFVDWLLGSIPLVGDIFDVGWQANQKNARLIAEYVRTHHSVEAHT